MSSSARSIQRLSANPKNSLLCVDLCQVLLTLVERFIMFPRSRSRTHHLYVLLLYCKYAIFHPPQNILLLHWEKTKNMFARFYQNKCSKFSIIFLSKVVVKRDMGYTKYKRWTQKRSKVKKRRKRKRNENKDNPYSRKKYSTKDKYISESIVELG